MKINLEILTTDLGCAKCERAMSIITKVVKDFKEVKVIKTNIEDHPEKLIKYGVMSTPAIIINGKLEFEGPPNEEKLKKKIKELLA